MTVKKLLANIVAELETHVQVAIVPRDGQIMVIPKDGMKLEIEEVKLDSAGSLVIICRDSAELVQE